MEFFNNQQLGHQAHKGSVISCGLTRGESSGRSAPAPSGPGAAAPHSRSPQRARPPLPSHQKGWESLGRSLCCPLLPNPGFQENSSSLLKTSLDALRPQLWAARGPARGRAGCGEQAPSKGAVDAPTLGGATLSRVKVSSSGARRVAVQIPWGPIGLRGAWLVHAPSGDLERAVPWSPL